MLSDCGMGMRLDCDLFHLEGYRSKPMYAKELRMFTCETEKRQY